MKNSATVLIAGLLASGCSTYQPADGQDISGFPSLWGQQAASSNVSFYQKGADHLRHGRYGLAVQDLKRSLVQEGETSKVLSALGVAYDGIGRRDVALAFLERAVEKDPVSMIARNNLGVALLNLGNTEAARFHLERAQGGNIQLADTAAYNLAKTIQAKVEKTAAAQQVQSVALPDREVLAQSPRPAPIQAAQFGRQPVNSVSAAVQVAQTVSDGQVQAHAQLAAIQQAAPASQVVVPAAQSAQTAVRVLKPVVVAFDPQSAMRASVSNPTLEISALPVEPEQTAKTREPEIEMEQLALLPAKATDKIDLEPAYVEMEQAPVTVDYTPLKIVGLDDTPAQAESLAVAAVIQPEPAAQTSIEMPAVDSRTIFDEIVAMMALGAMRSDYPEEAPVTSYGHELRAIGLPGDATMVASAPAVVNPREAGNTAVLGAIPAPRLLVDVTYNIVQPNAVAVVQKELAEDMPAVPVLTGWSTRVILVAEQQAARPETVQKQSVPVDGNVVPLVVSAAFVVGGEG